MLLYDTPEVITSVIRNAKGYVTTMLAGQLADQSALIGVLNELHDMGCPIISVECVEA